MIVEEIIEDAIKNYHLSILAALVLISIDEDVRISEILLCAKEQGMFTQMR